MPVADRENASAYPTYTFARMNHAYHQYQPIPGQPQHPNLKLRVRLTCRMQTALLPSVLSCTFLPIRSPEYPAPSQIKVQECAGAGVAVRLQDVVDRKLQA
ncbi:hypothetical protein FIBSPDRAFT_946595 [Athelia psychrophila]|uniref:Uncharacterized protein n=1 Tax=Athelia psychrophila TaxID=1759441 RepID=A0A166SQK8_9AGAM|nr:hypothetical protein FIBSPDRAFT_946595 [Fibularhizoctonia sp. CBS 109695]